MLNITTDKPQNTARVLKLSGKIIIDNSYQLRDSVRRAIEEEPSVRCIILDLSNVTSIDSTGIGELVSSYTYLNNQGKALKLLNLTRKVHDLLTITRLITVFEVYDNEQEALESCS